MLDESGSPLPGAAFIVTGGHGTVLEGTSASDGQVRAELDRAGVPYQLTVAAPERGASSIVEVRSSIEASLTLASGLWRNFGSRAPFRVILSNLGETELVAIGGAGAAGGSWVDRGILDHEYFASADQFSLFVIIYEQQWAALDGWPVGRPFRPQGNEPLRLIRAVEPSSAPFPSEVTVDVSAGESPTVHMPIEIRLPTTGAYRPAVRIVDADARRQEGGWPLGIPIPVGSSRIVPNEDGTGLQGDLLLFDDPELHPDELTLYLIDNAGHRVGWIETTPHHPLVTVPEVEGAVTIEGDSVSGLRFSADAPEWSRVRLELLQLQELDRRTVRWIVTSTSGRLPTTRLPVLPSEMSLSSIGFDTAAGCEADCEVRVELQHDLLPQRVLRDTPPRPYVRGQESTPTAATLRDVPF